MDDHITDLLRHESPIVWALAFIDSYGYRIYDINYHAWMQMYGATHPPQISVCLGLICKV